MTPDDFKAHINAVVELPTDRVSQVGTLSYVYQLTWWDSDKSIEVEYSNVTATWYVKVSSRQDDCGLDVMVTRHSTDFTAAYRAALQGHVEAVQDSFAEIQTFYQGLIERTKAELEAIK